MSQYRIWLISGILGIVIIFSVGIYGIFFIIRPRQQEKARVVAEHARLTSLLEKIKGLKGAAQNYQKDMSQQGTPLRPGHIIDLEEMANHNLMGVKTDLPIQKFSFAILPEDAPADAVELEVITDQLRIVMTKGGQGTLYRK